MQIPSHKYLIDKFLDWELVKYRLSIYKNINSHYDLSLFQECSTKSPYYCHYLAWRLGTWENESIFEFIDHLFGVASSLPNWRSEKHLLRSQEYNVFWSLLWQMQIAAYFYERKKLNVEWFEQSSGPDLKINQGNLDLFIECYNFTKSFSIENFISDIFSQLNPKIKVEHKLFLRLSLPNSGQELESFLNKIFSPYLNESFLHNKEQEAEKEYPILLPIPEDVNNFYIYLEGNDPNKYTPGIKPMGAGDPNAYLNQMVREALKNKMDSNKLKDHHPNILAINFLIGADLQNILMHNIHTPGFRIPDEYFQVFDCLVFEACGIDEIPNINTYFTPYGTTNHIIHKALGN
jgi:hypothetical protein